MTRKIERVAIMGTGVIGASWAALFLAKGLDVIATDIAPSAESSLNKLIDAAWPALEGLGRLPAHPDRGSNSRLKSKQPSPM
jgi:3-hydroxyacyl-CoA dehydrogenase